MGTKEESLKGKGRTVRTPNVFRVTNSQFPIDPSLFPLGVGARR